jgi:hypothetical protein
MTETIPDAWREAAEARHIYAQQEREERFREAHGFRSRGEETTGSTPMAETIPEAKRHLREARQDRAAEFWQQTIQAGRATHQAQAAETKADSQSDKLRQPRQT